MPSLLVYFISRMWTGGMEATSRRRRRDGGRADTRRSHRTNPLLHPSRTRTVSQVSGPAALPRTRSRSPSVDGSDGDEGGDWGLDGGYGGGDDDDSMDTDAEHAHAHYNAPRPAYTNTLPVPDTRGVEVDWAVPTGPVRVAATVTAGDAVGMLGPTYASHLQGTAVPLGSGPLFAALEPDVVGMVDLVLSPDNPSVPPTLDLYRVAIVDVARGVCSECHPVAYACPFAQGQRPLPPCRHLLAGKILLEKEEEEAPFTGQGGGSGGAVGRGLQTPLIPSAGYAVTIGRGGAVRIGEVSVLGCVHEWDVMLAGVGDHVHWGLCLVILPPVPSHHDAAFNPSLLFSLYPSALLYSHLLSSTHVVL